MQVLGIFSSSLLKHDTINLNGHRVFSNILSDLLLTTTQCCRFCCLCFIDHWGMGLWLANGCRKELLMGQFDCSPAWIHSTEKPWWVESSKVCKAIVYLHNPSGEPVRMVWVGRWTWGSIQWLCRGVFTGRAGSKTVLNNYFPWVTQGLSEKPSALDGVKDVVVMIAEWVEVTE